MEIIKKNITEIMKFIIVLVLKLKTNMKKKEEIKYLKESRLNLD